MAGAWCTPVNLTMSHGYPVCGEISCKLDHVILKRLRIQVDLSGVWKEKECSGGERGVLMCLSYHSSRGQLSVQCKDHKSLTAFGSG